MAKKAYIGVPKTSNSITSLLLHGENIADSSGNNYTITNSGVTVSSNQSKFGGKSLYFDGSSYMKIALPISGDCTVDFWFYQESYISSYPTPMNFTSGDSRGLYMHVRTSATYYAASTSSASENETGADAISLNSWHHIAFVRSGTTTKFYLDGVLQGTLTGTLTTNDVLYLGYLHDYPDITWFNGWIDELRVSKVARWTANFTPPTSAYSTDGEITTASVAREIKKGYIGVSGVARQIKKAYIGIGGVARPFWGGGELGYYGTITSLSQARYRLSATTVGNYALFGGGHTGAVCSNVVDAYNPSLTRSTPTAMTNQHYVGAATSVGDYALFAGGYSGTTSIYAHEKVDAYNKSLTLTTVTALCADRHSLPAASVGNYALFGGGGTSTGATTGAVDAYDTALTRSTPSTIQARHDVGAATVGNYALFAGGGISGDSGWSTVYAFNTSLTRTTATSLPSSAARCTGTSVGNYALFVYSNRYIAAYDTSLVQTAITTDGFSQLRYYSSATSVGDYALFGGGQSGAESANTYYATVDAYDVNLTHTVPTALSVKKSKLAATSIGDYALFGGGASTSSVVDAYTLV